MSKEIDKIIDSASTEDEAIETITKIARKNHGDGPVDQIIDASSDEETAKQGIIKLASNPGQNWFDKNFWGMVDTLSPIGKAVSHGLTPLTESARGPFQYIAQNVGENTSQTPPIDPFAEFNDPLGPPSDRAGLGTLLTDISNSVGIKQGRLAENVNIPRMPRTSAALEHLSNPAELSAAILEGMAGTKNFKVPGLEKLGTMNRLRSVVDDIPQPVKDLGNEFYPSGIMDPLTNRTNKRTMIQNYVKQAALDRGLLDEIMANGQFEYMVDMLENNPDLIKPFDKQGSLDLLDGPIVSEMNTETNRMGHKRDPKQGQIGKLATQQGMIIDEIPDNYSVNREDFLQSALNELPGGLDESQRATSERLISDSVKPVQRDPLKADRVQRTMDLRDNIQNTAMEYGNEPDLMPNPEYREDLQWLSDLPVETNMENVFPRRTQSNTTVMGKDPSGHGLIPGFTDEVITETDLGREFNPTPKNQNVLDIVQGQQNKPKMIPSSRKDQLKVQIAQMMDELTAIDDPGVQNMDQYNEFMYNQNQAEAGPFLNQQRKTGNVYIDQQNPFMDPREVSARDLAGRALENAASEGLKQPMSELPQLTQELYRDTNRGISTRRNYKDLLSGSRVEKNSMGKAVPQGDVERGIVSKTLGMADEFIVPAGHKIADYLGRQGVQYGNAMSKLAPVSIQSYKIPRNSEQIMAEKDYVISKIEKEMGPQYSADLKMIEDPEAVKLFLRQVELTRPDIFEKDPYARMDGIIDHPILKQKALEDTVKNNQLPVLERANLVEDLLLNNRFLG